MKPVIDFIKTHSNVFQFRLKYDENGNTPSNEIRREETDLMNDNNLNILWDFGDGHFSTERTPIHTYAIPGNYKVKAYLDYGQYENAIHIFDPRDSHPEPGDVPPATRGFDPQNSNPDHGDVPPASRGFDPRNSSPDHGDVPPASRGFDPQNSNPDPGDVPPASRGFDPQNSNPDPGDVPPASRGFDPRNSSPDHGDVPPASRGFDPQNSNPDHGDVPPASRSLGITGLGIEPPTFPDSASVAVMRGIDWQSVQGTNGTPPSLLESDLLSVSFPKFSTNQVGITDKVYVLVTFNKVFNKDHYLVLGYNDISNNQNELILSRVTDRWEEVRWKPLVANGATVSFRDNVIVNLQGREHLLLEFWTTEREKDKLNFLIEVVSTVEMVNSSSLSAIRHDHLLGSIDLR